jgi:hypothetical protein
MGVVYQPAVAGQDLPMSTPEDQDTGLKRSLRSRHMTMISLGGVIGAGLFVGSGAVMNQTALAARRTGLGNEPRGDAAAHRDEPRLGQVLR